MNVPSSIINIDIWTHRYQMVWRETSNTYHEMLSAEGWTNKQEINVPIVQSLTFKVWIFARRFWILTLLPVPQLALLIIGKCGFGFSFNWLEPPRSADGKMTIQHALRVISDSPAAVLFVPKWLQRLSVSGYVKQLVFIYLAFWLIYNFIGWRRS